MNATTSAAGRVPCFWARLHWTGDDRLDILAQRTSPGTLKSFGSMIETSSDSKCMRTKCLLLPNCHYQVVVHCDSEKARDVPFRVELELPKEMIPCEGKIRGKSQSVCFRFSMTMEGDIVFAQKGLQASDGEPQSQPPEGGKQKKRTKGHTKLVADKLSKWKAASPKKAHSEGKVRKGGHIKVRKTAIKRALLAVGRDLRVAQAAKKRAMDKLAQAKLAVRTATNYEKIAVTRERKARTIATKLEEGVVKRKGAAVKISEKTQGKFMQELEAIAQQAKDKNDGSNKALTEERKNQLATARASFAEAIKKARKQLPGAEAFSIKKGSPLYERAMDIYKSKAEAAN